MRVTADENSDLPCSAFDTYEKVKHTGVEPAFSGSI